MPRLQITLATMLALTGVLHTTRLSAQDRSWMLGPFEKPQAANPVVSPRASSTFRSPVSDSVVRWEEYATFNPAAAVRNGEVTMLYRAEDASGDEKIGHHTSRLGMAESGDGLRFVRRAE